MFGMTLSVMTKDAMLELERQVRPVGTRLHTGRFLYLSSIENAKSGLARYLMIKASPYYLVFDSLYYLLYARHYNPRFVYFSPTF